MSLHTTIVPVSPYRLDLTTRALRRVSSNIVDVVTPDGKYLRAFSDNDGVNIIEAQQTRSDRLEIRITGRNARDRLETVRTMLGTGVDLRRWYRRVARFPWLTALARDLRGLKPPRYPDLWEALCNGIVFQQLSIAAASTIMRRFVERFSNPIEHEGACLYPFPAAGNITGTSDLQLQRLGLSRQKAAYLKNAANAVTSHSVTATHIESLSTSVALLELQKIPGIGRWSAANILLRGFGRLDVFPPTDSGAARNIKMLSGDPEISLEEVLVSLDDMQGMLYFHLLLGRLSRAKNA